MPFLFDSTQLLLEIDPILPTQAWQQSQSLATPASRWNAYLNRLCLNSVLPWLRQNYAPQAAPAPHQATLASFWELVNGTAIRLGDTRIVLIPTEAIDAEELRVPQEWVDIPGWAADYYGSVQVNPDEQWVRLAGFATHHQLKTWGDLDRGDRTYSLDATDLVPDFGTLWIAQQLAPETPTRAELASLPALPTGQAENLIERLANPTLLTPRLELPFDLWGALLQHGGWRQRLAERRWGMPEPQSVWQWLQNRVSDVGQQLGWERVELQPDWVGARSDAAAETTAGVSRPLAIAGQTYELCIFPIARPAGQVWRFELRNLTPGGRIPGGFCLRLLSEDLQPFENNEDRAAIAVDSLYVEVMLEPGEGIVWAVEPTPDEYDREILRF